MFTPEFISDDRGEYILIANHNLESAEAARFSISYNKSRIAFAESHLPPHIKQCRLIYDIRGQTVSEATFTEMRKAFENVCSLEFKQ